MTPSRHNWIKIQSVIGTEMDGIPGPKDDAAIAALRESAVSEYQASRAKADSRLDALTDRTGTRACEEFSSRR